MHPNREENNNNDIIQAEKRGLTMGQLVENVTKITGLRCTPAMIYNYEKQGLLTPSARTQGNFRLFSMQDLQRTVCIKRRQSQGMSLSEIKQKIDSCEDEFNFDDICFDLPVDRRIQILQAAAVIFP